MNKIRLSVFTKILLGFMVVIFSVYILSIQIIITERNRTKDEILGESSSRVGFYLDSLEKQIAGIIKMQSQLINDRDLIDLASENMEIGGYQYYDLLNKARSKINNLAANSDYLIDALVVFPSLGLKITGVSESDILHRSKIDDLTESEYLSLQKVFEAGAYPFCNWGDDICILIASDSYQEKSDIRTNGTFFIIVRISKEELADSLKGIKADDQGGAMLISSSYGLDIADITDSEMVPVLKAFTAGLKFVDKQVGMELQTVKNDRYIVLYEFSMLLNSALVTYVPETRLFESLKEFSSWIWIMTGLSLMIIFIFSIWIRRLVIKPLGKLAAAFNEIKGGNLKVSVKYEKKDEFGILYEEFNDMFRKLNILVNEVYEQKLLVKNAELKQLQYQINPHFLYNSILIVQNLIEMDDYESAKTLAQRLNSYYHYIAKGSSPETRLLDEVNHARAYVDIQAVRFSNRLSVEFGNIPDFSSQLFVPRLILQPLIENTFKHGLKDMLRDGILRVRMDADHCYLYIFIEDNGSCLTDEKLEEMKEILEITPEQAQDSCLANIHQRILMKFGEGSGLSFTRSSLGGLCVEVRIRLQQ